MADNLVSLFLFIVPWCFLSSSVVRGESSDARATAETPALIPDIRSRDRFGGTEILYSGRGLCLSLPGTSSPNISASSSSSLCSTGNHIIAGSTDIRRAVYPYKSRNSPRLSAVPRLTRPLTSYSADRRPRREPRRAGKETV